ncbi:hypothetical protein [Microbacterium panaciterrae]|uniref:RelA/SpoT domain-containing protein n=1 Tax=Microbacterium panaciterrae TaxID=985759 RepID=A0ABP8PVG6_9MICO
MCRSIDAGGRRCLHHEDLRTHDLKDLEPDATENAPHVDWGNVPTAEELYDEFGPTVAGTAIHDLERIAKAEPAITAAVIDAMPDGCRMHGLEYRMKSPRSLAAKIQKKLDADPSRSPRTISASLSDFIRYTVVAPHASDVVPAAHATINTLIERGWTLKELEHSYVNGNPYKGLHSIVLENSTGQDVEIQFHAEDGIAIKDQFHVEYEVARDPHTPRARRVEAHQTMVDAWSTVITPGGLQNLTIGGVSVQPKSYPAPRGPAAREQPGPGA